jgi:hypothetical protein
METAGHYWQFLAALPEIRTGKRLLAQSAI